MMVRNIRFITPLLLICIAHIEAGAQRIVCDDTCKSADAATVQTVGNQGPEYAVVSPVGQSAVEMIGQAPRLETLDGKTIAVVGVSFMTHITHPEIKRLIKEHYPSADVILLDERGKQYSSMELAKVLQDKISYIGKDITFVIGGAYGFSQAVYDRADSKISLSKMTFSHQMVRAIFVEQIYRAFTIMRGEPYHHE